MGFIKRFVWNRLAGTGVLLATIGSLIFLNTAHSQGCKENCIFEYSDFSGGLNTRLSKFALPKTQADVAENIRLDTEYKSITKRDKTVVACTADSTGPITGLYRFYQKDGSKITLAMFSNTVVTCDDTTGLPTTILTVSSADHKWSCETWHDIAICTDGTNQPIKYDGSSASATYLGSALATDAGSGAGPDGTYNYKISCYSVSYEEIFNQPSNNVTVVDNDINLTMIPVCPDTILGESTTGRKVYRSDNTGGGTYKLLSNGTIADNTTLILTDSDADGALGASYPAGDGTVRPPLGRFPLIHKNRLWLANNSTNPSRLFYSEDASHDYFLSDSYFDIRPNDGDEITFVLNWLGLLTASKTNTIQKIDTSGDDPDADWAVTDPFSFVGCQAPYSAVETDRGIMYLGNNGIYNFTGQYSELISDKITPEIKDILPSNYANVWAVYFKNTYYMAYTSNRTGSSTNNRILLANLIDQTFTIDLFNINVFHVFDAGSDVEALFSGASNSGKIYGHTDTNKQIIHKVHGDFTGTWDDMRYIPTSVGGDADDPILELAWTATIDSVSDSDWTGTIDSVTTSIIDRPDTNGNYISQALTLNASSLDKLYWNETLPANGGDVTFDIRSATNDTAITSAGWTTGFTDSSGSDISTATPNTVIQYRINMSTNTITETPTLYREGNYVIRLTYDITGTSDETTIPLTYRTGWLDFGYPGYVKELTKIYVYYDWNDNTSGTLHLKFTGLGAGTYTSSQTETDSFDIDLLQYPDFYVERFPGGSMIGELIELEITESSLNPIKIKKIIVVYNVQNLT